MTPGPPEPPAWWDDPDDPRQRAMIQLTDAIAERLDQDDGLEQVMRLQAGTVALHVSRQEGATFLDLTTTGVVIRDAPTTPPDPDDDDQHGNDR